MITNYKSNVNLFSLKLSSLKPKNNKNKEHLYNKILYCIAKYDINEGWKAFVNTKGLDNYEDITILDFTTNSFDLYNKTIVFSKEKDKTNHWVKFIRDKLTSKIAPGTEEQYNTLCDNRIFSGYLVYENKLKFDMVSYIGTVSENDYLILKTNE